MCRLWSLQELTMEEKIVYFEIAGEENTVETLQLAKERALQRGISYVVLASTRGYTAERALKVFKDTDIHLIAVTHQYGSLEGELFDDAVKQAFERAGHTLYIATHLFSTHRFWESTKVPGTMTNALYRFSQGMKVCIEIVLMAANGGLIPVGADVVAVGGTDIGADTAVVIRAVTSRNFNALQVREVICKPLYSPPATMDVINKRVKELQARRKK
jgi:hypothetical protein